MVDYTIDIVTGNMPYADTYEQVHIVLIGTKGQSEEMALRKACSDGFIQGQTDRFTLRDVPDLGKLNQVQITLTPFDFTTSYVKAWFLEQVRVVHTTQDNTLFTWTCRCSKWLGTESGQQLSYMLPVSAYRAVKQSKRLSSRAIDIEMKKKSKQGNYDGHMLPLAAQRKGN